MDRVGKQDAKCQPRLALSHLTSRVQAEIQPQNAAQEDVAPERGEKKHEGAGQRRRRHARAIRFADLALEFQKATARAVPLAPRHRDWIANRGVWSGEREKGGGLPRSGSLYSRIFGERTNLWRRFG